MMQTHRMHDAGVSPAVQEKLLFAQKGALV